MKSTEEHQLHHQERGCKDLNQNLHITLAGIKTLLERFHGEPLYWNLALRVNEQISNS